MNIECKKLIDHVNRIEGQLKAIKRELEQDTVDCSKVSNVVSAASRSFSSFRMGFVKTFLEMKFGLGKKKLEDEMMKGLLSIIKS